MRLEGFEPSTFGLRDRYSTTKLQTQICLTYSVFCFRLTDFRFIASAPFLNLYFSYEPSKQNN